MGTRTGWLAGLLVGLALIAPGAANAQGPNYGPPSIELPIPTMWGQRDEGPYFAMEAMYMRLNTPLRRQPLAVRGIRDEAGQIDGNTLPGNTTVTFVDGAGLLIVTMFENPGIAGRLLGSGDLAVAAKDVAAARFEPGVRLTFGYRLQDGVAVEAVYWRLAEFKHTAGASILPPDQNVGNNFADSFLTLPFYNFSPFFAGPNRDVVSNVVTSLVPGYTPGIPVLLSAAQVAEARLYGGIPIAAFGIFNAADDVQVSFTQEIHNFELNTRFDVCTTENTRTYSIAGFRHIQLEEEFRLRVADADIDGFIAPEDTATYRNRWTNRMFGLQAGMGNESYLGNGFALSIEGRVGLLANMQKTEVTLTRGDQGDDEAVGHKSNRNDLDISPLFQLSAYLWWYPVEGVQLRVGYEGTGMLNVLRSHYPVDFNIGRLDPEYKQMFLRFDGFSAGFALIF